MGASVNTPARKSADNNSPSVLLVSIGECRFPPPLPVKTSRAVVLLTQQDLFAVTQAGLGGRLGVGGDGPLKVIFGVDASLASPAFLPACLTHISLAAAKYIQ